MRNQHGPGELKRQRIHTFYNAQVTYSRRGVPRAIITGMPNSPYIPRDPERARRLLEANEMILRARAAAE